MLIDEIRHDLTPRYLLIWRKLLTGLRAIRGEQFYLRWKPAIRRGDLRQPRRARGQSKASQMPVSSECRLPAGDSMSAIVKGFGCRPMRAGSDVAQGRRPKASRGGSRGPGPWAMAISPRGLVGGIVRGARRRWDASTEMPGSPGFAAPGRDPGSPQGPFPRSARSGSPALWPSEAAPEFPGHVSPLK